MKKLIVTAVLTGTAMFIQAEVKELQVNGSFESLDNNNMPVKWVNNDVFKADGKLGKVTVLTEGAQDGKNCVEIRTSPSELVHLFSGTMVDVKPGDKIRAGAYVYSAKPEWCGDLVQKTESIDAKDWTLKEVTLEVPDKEYPGKGRIGKVRPLFQVDGDAALQIDNVKFSVETK